MRARRRHEARSATRIYGDLSRVRPGKIACTAWTVMRSSVGIGGLASTARAPGLESRLHGGWSHVRALHGK
jgi:hypothetical protein